MNRLGLVGEGAGKGDPSGRYTMSRCSEVGMSVMSSKHSE